MGLELFAIKIVEKASNMMDLLVRFVSSAEKTIHWWEVSAGIGLVHTFLFPLTIEASSLRDVLQGPSDKEHYAMKNHQSDLTLLQELHGSTLVEMFLMNVEQCAQRMLRLAVKQCRLKLLPSSTSLLMHSQWTSLVPSIVQPMLCKT